MTSDMTRSGMNNNAGASIHADIYKMEKLWAKELYELSVEDRETINDELHGASVSNMCANRDDELLERADFCYLNSFQNEIDTKIRLEDKQSYIDGIGMGSAYITSSEFRLRFLRAERYDVGQAVIRYCKCLDFLVEIFGKYALLRPLLIKDLSRKEMKFLREGYIQVLPSRDRLGRRIVAQLGDYGGPRFTQIEWVRVYTYLTFSVVAGDMTTQRLGVVSIASFTRGIEESFGRDPRTISKLMSRYLDAAPLRWSAIHLCIPDDPIYNLMKSLLLFFIGSNKRRMLRMHVGSPVECDYKLRSFGIPTEDIPRTHTNTIKLKNHTRLIKGRKVIDSFVEKAMITNGTNDVKFPGIECPEINCVLFGRHSWDHPGNVEFRGLLQEIMLSRKERDFWRLNESYCVIKIVIQESLSRKFRFLIYDRETSFYKEATEYEEIWGLVDQSVREYRKRSRAKRMTYEAKAASDSSTSSPMGVQRNDRGKFAKDCKCPKSI